jgi:acetyltransferase
MSATTKAQRMSRGMGIALGDGRRVAIRPIDPADADGLCAFYRALAPRSRYARFLGIAVGIGDAEIRQFACVDHVTSDGLVAVLHEQGQADGSIVGHLCLEPEGTGTNELAVAVADGFRGFGIGKAMMEMAVEFARQRGLHRLSATMFATNLPMRRLMIDAGLPPAADDIDAGVESIELELAA